MLDKKCILSFVSCGEWAAGEGKEMRIRLLALVGLLGVVGSIMNAERSTSQTAMVVQEGGAGPAKAFDDPYPPPTPRP